MALLKLILDFILSRLQAAAENKTVN